RSGWVMRALSESALRFIVAPWPCFRRRHDAARPISRVIAQHAQPALRFAAFFAAFFFVAFFVPPDFFAAFFVAPFFAGVRLLPAMLFCSNDMKSTTLVVVPS